MERDFLGAMWKEEEGRTESDYMGGEPAMQWSFPSKVKAGTAPALMSFRLAREDGSATGGATPAFDKFSLSGFHRPAGDAFDGIKKQASPVLALQKSFRFGSQGNLQQQYTTAHGQRAQSLEFYGASHLGGSGMVPVASRHPVPFSTSNPMLRVQSSPDLPDVTNTVFKNQSFAVSNVVAGSSVGVYGPRDLPSAKSAQLTIFYGGSVSVFDNVLAEKAQELMLLASKISIPSTSNAGHKLDSPISAPAKVTVPQVIPARQVLTQKPEHSVPHVSGISSPMLVMPKTVTLSRSTSSSNNDSTEPKSAGPPPVVPTISQPSSSQAVPLTTTTAASIMPTAVPQARKASLARFLEKRKERVTSVVPYPSSKSSLESRNTQGSANAASKLSGNHDESLRLGQPRNISFSSEESPSTKLQI